MFLKQSTVGIGIRFLLNNQGSGYKKNWSF